MKAIVSAGVAGLVFGVGLALSGMVNPAKVIGFLDLFGNWDPSLGLVMGGAVGVLMIAYPMVMRRQRPVCEADFNLPAQTKIDPNLIIGSGMFGVGWGLVGFCPGPSFSSLSLGLSETWVFFAAMIAGMAAFRLLFRISSIPPVQIATEDG